MADTNTAELSVLEQLQADRRDALDAIGNAIAQREQERTSYEQRADVPEDEQDAFAEQEHTFKRDHGSRKQRLEQLDQRIDEEELKQRRLAVAADASRADARVSVTREALTYERGNGRSYFRDFAITQVRGADATLSGSQVEARARLEHHGLEVDVEWPKIQDRMKRDAYSKMENAEQQFTGSFRSGIRTRGLEHNPFDSFEQRVTPNRLDGQGGYFVQDLVAA